MARVVAYLAGGIAVVLAMDFVAATTGVLGPGAAPAEIAAGTPDRSRKGDRLAASRPAGNPNQAIATVEVLGQHDAAILYRDRDGRVLFRTDPQSNVTVIAKGVFLPKVTIREPNEPAREPSRPVRELGRGVDRAPARVPEAAPERKLLDGCDPSFSPVAAPTLSHITGRCIAELKGTQKLAALLQ